MNNLLSGTALFNDLAKAIANVQVEGLTYKVGRMDAMFGDYDFFGLGPDAPTPYVGVEVLVKTSADFMQSDEALIDYAFAHIDLTNVADRCDARVRVFYRDIDGGRSSVVIAWKVENDFAPVDLVGWHVEMPDGGDSFIDSSDTASFNKALARASKNPRVRVSRCYSDGRLDEIDPEEDSLSFYRAKRLAA